MEFRALKNFLLLINIFPPIIREFLEIANLSFYVMWYALLQQSIGIHR